jgi:hypothetical protein
MRQTIDQSRHLRCIRICLGILIAGLVVSGVTAFPLETELHWLLGLRAIQGLPAPALGWLERVSAALTATNAQYPFLAYGTDWLAFGHLVIAAAFFGPYVDPVRNKWFVTFGLIACAGVIPLALIAGPVRGIPFGWRLIDCSFGVFGCLPLLVCRRSIGALEREEC